MYLEGMMVPSGRNLQQAWCSILRDLLFVFETASCFQGGWTHLNSSTNTNCTAPSYRRFAGPSLCPLGTGIRVSCCRTARLTTQPYVQMLLLCAWSANADCVLCFFLFSGELNRFVTRLTEQCAGVAKNLVAFALCVADIYFSRRCTRS